MSEIYAFLIISVILAFGDIVSIKTKAMIPSVFIASIIFLVGFWTKIPANILELSGIGKDLIYLFFYLLLVHMGTLISIKELIRQWKTIVIALCGVIGVCFGTLTIGTILFGWQTVVIATPPLTGGVIAVEMMREVAFAKGLDEYAIIAIVVLVLQGFFGYPLTSIMLKKEGNSLLKRFRNNEFNNIKTTNESEILIKIIAPVIGIILSGIVGMAIFSMIIGKCLGYSKEMSFSIALTSLYGFPENYILTEEATNAIAKTEEEKMFLMDQMLPKMLVAGITTVTIASVIIAGVFVKFL